MDISNNIITNNTDNVASENTSKKKSKSKNTNDCVELKNLEYKNVLMFGNNLKPDNMSIDVSEIGDILNKELELNKLELWTKLDKTVKIKKLNEYSKILKEKYTLGDEETKSLNAYFLYCLDRKYLSRMKDIEYVRETGIIKNIPNLTFKEDSRTFYIKKPDKHGTTLKTLAPKKNKTVKQ